MNRQSFTYSQWRNHLSVLCFKHAVTDSQIYHYHLWENNIQERINENLLGTDRRELKRQGRQVILARHNLIRHELKPTLLELAKHTVLGLDFTRPTSDNPPKQLVFTGPALFWDTIAQNRNQLENLKATLVALSRPDLDSFYSLLLSSLDAANTLTLQCICDTLICPGDAVFLEFRLWLIMQGETFYYRALSSPTVFFSNPPVEPTNYDKLLPLLTQIHQTIFQQPLKISGDQPPPLSVGQLQQPRFTTSQRKRLEKLLLNS